MHVVCTLSHACSVYLITCHLCAEVDGGGVGGVLNEKSDCHHIHEWIHNGVISC